MSKRSIEKIPVIGPLSKLPFGKYILLWFTINIGLAVLCIVLSITPIINFFFGPLLPIIFVACGIINILFFNVLLFVKIPIKLKWIK